MFNDIKELKGIERIHLMGIGGSGMSGLALILSGMGYEVSGCDLSRSDAFSETEKRRIECVIGHSPAHIGHFAPQLVVYSSAVDSGHEELTEAREAGTVTAGRGRVLSWLFNAHRGIGVAGTHGKTTTSSMIGLILERMGRDPTLAVGAEVCDFGTNARVGRSGFFVAEIDESDGSFELFSPEVTVVTNVDWDHVNYFPSRQDVVDAFIRFAGGRKPGAPLIVCAEDEGVQAVLSKISPNDSGPVITCGWGKAWNWGAYDLVRKKGGGVSFSVAHDGEEAGRAELSVSGEHNVMNALQACAAAFETGISFTAAAEVLSTFRGARHRLEKTGKSGNVEVIDDYGHHPTEITATLAALGDMYPEERLVVVFQPHRFTRTSVFWREIAQSLSVADAVLLLPVYSAGEKEETGITSKDIFDVLKESHPACFLCDGKDDAIARLNLLFEKESPGGDVLLTLGAGDVSGLGKAWMNQARRPVS